MEISVDSLIKLLSHFPTVVIGMIIVVEIAAITETITVVETGMIAVATARAGVVTITGMITVVVIVAEIVVARMFLNDLKRARIPSTELSRRQKPVGRKIVRHRIMQKMADTVRVPAMK